MAPPAAKKGGAFDLTHQIFKMTNMTYADPEPVDAVFVCIDCEAFEFAQHKVTELGVAVLDTKDVVGIEPGENGEKWVEKMTCAHYRPVEYANVVNRRFVKGAESFFAFGDTTWINLKDAAKVLSRIFRSPEHLLDAANFDLELADTKRNVVFVAHGISNDDVYMSKLGYQLNQAANVTRKVDSQRVAGGTQKNSVGLKRLLEKLGVQYQGLHNGGNDAAYTLQALVVMAVKEQQEPGVIFGPNDLPALTLPGTVRAEGVPAPHVYGGTAVRGDVELPIDGGQNGRKKYIKKATGTKKGPNANKNFSTASPASLGQLGGGKRLAPADDATESGPKRKKPTS